MVGKMDNDGWDSPNIIKSESFDDDKCIACYNDPFKYPTMKDIAKEMNVSHDTLKKQVKKLHKTHRLKAWRNKTTAKNARDGVDDIVRFC